MKLFLRNLAIAIMVLVTIFVVQTFALNLEQFFDSVYDSANDSLSITINQENLTGNMTVAGYLVGNGDGGDNDSYIEGDTDTALLYLDAGNDRVGISTSTPDNLLHIEATTALTNTVSYPTRITHETSGTPAANIGVGIQYEQETSAANNEVIMALDAIVDDATATSEDASFSVKLMEAGAAAAEKFAVESSGILTLVNGETLDNSVDGIVATSGAFSVGGDVTLANNIYLSDAGSGNTVLGYNSALTNSVLNLLFLRHTTSGTPANGIGVGLDWQVETSADNNEIVASIQGVVSDTTATSEDGEFVFYTMTAGSSSEKLRIHDTGEVQFQYGILPDAVTADPCGSGYPEGSIFYNDTANVLCFCDGTNDLKIADGSACF